MNIWYSAEKKKSSRYMESLGNMTAMKKKSKKPILVSNEKKQESFWSTACTNSANFKIGYISIQ